MQLILAVALSVPEREAAVVNTNPNNPNICPPLPRLLDPCPMLVGAVQVNTVVGQPQSAEAAVSGVPTAARCEQKLAAFLWCLVFCEALPAGERGREGGKI